MTHTRHQFFSASQSEPTQIEMKLILPYLLLLSACPFAYAQTTYYVPDDFTTIQAGIDGCQNGDTVIVRDGVYNELIKLNARAITLRSENGLAFTTISGSGLSGTAVVTFENGEDENTVVDGFTIDGSSTGNMSGVSVNQSGPTLMNILSTNNPINGFLFNLAIVRLSDSTASNNTLNGIYCEDSSGVILNSVATLNRSGFLLKYCSDLDIINSEANANSGNWNGCGISISACNRVNISGCLISDNVSNDEGGGIWAVSGVHDLNLTNCVISGNTASSGGGLFYYSSGHDFLMEGCTLENNLSQNSGGAIYWRASSSTNLLSNSIIKSNTAQDGGAIHVPGVSNMFLNLENCLITDNLALGSSECGGIDSYGTYNTAVELNMDNCTLAFNHPENLNDWSNGIIKNTIIWPAITVSGLDLEYSCTQGGYLGIGNTPYEPLFASGVQGDYYLSQTSAGQSANSSCLNTGDPTIAAPYSTTRTDEISDSGRLDIGFHYPIDPPPPPPPPTDTDNDGISDDDEISMSFTDPNDDDTDDDGLSDGEEYFHSTLNLDPLSFDTDGDLLGDGLEVGMSNVNRLTGTDPLIFVPDSDTTTTTSPVKADSDGGGIIDSGEDTNMNGMVNGMETDPSAGNGDDDIVIGSISIAPQSLSMSNGGIAQIMIDFDDKYDSKRYMLLCSTTGDDTGFNLGRIHVPINFGAVLAKTLYSDYYNQMVNFNSDLNINGDALAMIVMPPNSPSSYAGLTLYFAALVIPPNGYPLSVTDSSSMGFTQ
jgi:hypothetical protein